MEVVHYPLHPQTPPEGRSLLDLFGGSQAAPRLRQAQERLKNLAEAEGLPMGERTHTYNSRLAQELGIWAEDQRRGKAFHEAVYRAYFVDGSNISDPDLLVQVAAGAGLDGGEARVVLEERSYRERVDEDWARSRRAGVDAVPTFEAGGSRLVGAEPYEALERLVVEAGARSRASEESR